MPTLSRVGHVSVCVLICFQLCLVVNMNFAFNFNFICISFHDIYLDLSISFLEKPLEKSGKVLENLLLSTTVKSLDLVAFHSLAFNLHAA